MCRSTFSTTTMASSTTIPIASTRPNSDSTLIEKPKPSSTANVPMIETGTATSGMTEARQRLQEQDHDEHDERDGFEQRMHDRLDRLAHEDRRVIHDRSSRRPAGSPSSAPPSWLRTAFESCQCVGVGSLEDRNGHRVLVVEQTLDGVLLRSPSRCVPHRPGVTISPSVPVLSTMSRNCCSSVRRPVAFRASWNCDCRGGRRADLAGCDLHVLLADGLYDIARRSGYVQPASADRARPALRNRRRRTAEHRLPR